MSDWRDLTEEDKDKIEEWLNNPENRDRWLRIPKMEPYTSKLINPPDPNSPIRIYEIHIHRQIVKLSKRYWLDVAMNMNNSGEPVVIVTHEGNVEEWWNERPKP